MDKTKVGSEGGLQSISVSPFPVLDEVDGPRRKEVGSAPLAGVDRHSGSYEQFRSDIGRMLRSASARKAFFSCFRDYLASKSDQIVDIFMGWGGGGRGEGMLFGNF